MNADEGPTGVSNFFGSIDPQGERELVPYIFSILVLHAHTGCSAATGYLTDDVLERPNLTVALESVVTRVLFDQPTPEEKPRASGVLFMTQKGGPLFAVSARREVIISTGAIVTPQLLMLSGIGPAEELKAHGIPVIHDLPMVGKGLLDVRHLQIYQASCNDIAKSIFQQAPWSFVQKLGIRGIIFLDPYQDLLRLQNGSCSGMDRCQPLRHPLEYSSIQKISGVYYRS